MLSVYAQKNPAGISSGERSDTISHGLDTRVGHARPPPEKKRLPRAFARRRSSTITLHAVAREAASERCTARHCRRTHDYIKRSTVDLAHQRALISLSLGERGRSEGALFRERDFGS